MRDLVFLCMSVCLCERERENVTECICELSQYELITKFLLSSLLVNLVGSKAKTSPLRNAFRHVNSLALGFNGLEAQLIFSEKLKVTLRARSL